MHILGVDPGSRHTGLALLCQTEDQKNWRCEKTVLLQPTGDFLPRLLQLQQAMADFLSRENVDVVAMESAFLSKNIQSTMKLAQARTALLLPALAKNLPIFEYAPRAVKQALFGRGQSSKEELRTWLLRLQLIDSQVSFDVSDAVAVALCHAYQTIAAPTAALYEDRAKQARQALLATSRYRRR
jgi:crossover junction endodeoxyribonuclease RuvC